MAIKVGDIELHVGPQEVGGPDDLKAAIINFIKGAKKRLDIAVQELDSREIAEAIIEARQKKRVVRLVIEGDYLTVDKAVPDSFKPGGKNETNRFLHDAVLRTNINVKSDFNPAIFHQKFIVRDNSAVLTGSTNFTDTGISKNLNHVVIIRNRAVANAYKKEFDEIMQGRFGKRSVAADDEPREVKVSGLRVKVLFAPDHAPEMEIMKQMLKAKNRIDFAVFTFAKSSGIDLGKLHHKLMVIDDHLVIAGSFNYTGPANKTNDENILVIGDLDETKTTVINKGKKIGQFARREIDRIRAQFGQAP
jgi:phosphatidylserine/phosphatidylglycerophosphate/cardiolipin synthase-like enzyme